MSRDRHPHHHRPRWVARPRHRGMVAAMPQPGSPTGRSSRHALLIASCASLLLAACADNPEPKIARTVPPPGRPQTVPAAPTLSGPPGLPAAVVAELASPDREVRFARNGRRGVLLTRSNERWLTGGLELDKDGKANLTAEGEEAAMREVASAPSGDMVASLQPSGEGFVLAWASVAGDSSTIFALQLDRLGRAQGKVQTLESGSRQLRWVEVLAHDSGTLLLWESSAAGGSELHVSAFEKSGISAPKRVAQGVRGWHTAAHQSGAALVWVSGKAETQGTPYYASIDSSGTPSPALALSSEASALLDIQTAHVGDQQLVAWTDARADDHHVYLTRIDKTGAQQGKAKPAVAPVGSHGLIALLAAEDGGRALLAWEPELGTAEGPRPIMLSTLDAQGQLSERAELELWAPGGSPQLVADGGGFAALTLAPVQPRGGEVAGGAPHYVRFDANLKVTATEPIRVAELAQQSVGVEGVPGIVRTLQCQASLCTVVAVGDGKPALLAIASLPQRRSVWRAPAKKRAKDQAPRARSLKVAQAAAQPIASSSAARLEDGRTLLSWVSHVPPDKDGLSPPQARLSYRFIAADGSIGRAHVISQRAISRAGVKVLPLRPNKRHNRRNPAVALIAWAGPNQDSAQVFVTQIGSNEKKLKQRTVTKQRRKQGGSVANEVADIDVALDNKGNIICAWSDSRDGNAEIYLARLSPTLEKTKVDRRISRGDGPSLEPRILVGKTSVQLAWSEAPSQTASSSIFTTRLNPGSLKTEAAPAALSKGNQHARTPRWSGQQGAQAWISWIEDGAAEGAPNTLVLAGVKDGVAQPRRIMLNPGHSITSAAIHCAQSGCRGTMLADAGGTLEVFGFEAPSSGVAAVRPRELALLPGGGAHDQSLSAVDGSMQQLFFHQRKTKADTIRQLFLDW